MLLLLMLLLMSPPPPPPLLLTRPLPVCAVSVPLTPGLCYL
eukprot:COSAG01_NODE_4291_length_5167_cov_3.885556_3_plen_41_part_00